jgi:RND family efflux transporter MFP subunit
MDRAVVVSRAQHGSARMIRIIAILLTLLLFGCGRSRAPELLPPRAVRVVIARPEASHRSTPYAGGLEPKVKLDLAFGVGGRVRAIGVNASGAPLREGDTVTKGQLLAELDNTDLKRQSSTASLAAASASAEVIAAKSAADQADADLVRIKKLVDAGVVPGVELEKVETASKAAHAKLETVRAQHGAKLEQAALARRIETDARMVSPIAGVIARRMIDPGENVVPSTIGFTVIDPTELQLVVAVPDARIGAVKIGQLVPIHTEALPGTALIGRVTTIHPVADPALRTFGVELTLDNGDGRLRAGMVASAALAGVAAKGGTLVPLASVVRAADGALAVFTLDDTRAVLRRVELGDLVGNDVVVESGVTEGDRVVSDGAPYLHGGETVVVLP